MPAESSLQHQIEKGIDILRRGGVVAFPTDTVYGLGAHVFREGAVERVFEVKDRSRGMPMPLLLAEISQMTSLAARVPPLAWILAREFLPGGLTLVLARGPVVPDLVTGGGSTVAVRVPAHPIALALIRALGSPITGTSANLSGRPSPLTAHQVREQLGDRVDLIIDGGRCPGGVESTVVDLTGEKPRILRQGAIPGEEIERVAGLLPAKGG